MAKLLFVLTLGISLCVTLTVAQGTVEIDTLEDLQRVGSEGSCYNYFYDYTGRNCKGEVPPTSTIGFWSSCDYANCELQVDLGKLVEDNSVPTRLDVLSFVSGSGSITVRGKVTPDSPYVNIQVIQRTEGWTTTQVLLDPSLGFTSTSEIYLRLASEPVDSEIDVLDKLTFVYGPVPTTTVPPTTTTTAAPTTTTAAPTTTTAAPPTTTAAPPTTTAAPPTTTAAPPTTTAAPPTTTAAPTRPPVDFECPTAEGLYRDPKNCRGFYNCDNYYPYHFCCPVILFFNPATGNCDFQENVQCDVDPGLACDSPPGLFHQYTRM